MSQVPNLLYEKVAASQFYEERYTRGYMDEWPTEKKQRVFSLIRQLGLPARGKALDIGCGKGVFTDVIQQALPEWEVYGAEISPTAVAHARERYPQCQFFVASDERIKTQKFDFIFSHHVLEHVYNVDDFFTELQPQFSDTARMLHICPCGNEGSLEDKISRLVKGGIDYEREERRFFEEPGHLRRLTTDRLATILQKHGFRLTREWYHQHYWSAIAWITEWQRAEVMKFTDPNLGTDPQASEQLKKFRSFLLPLTLLRLPLLTRRALQNKSQKTVPERIKLMVAWALFPVARPIDSWVSRKGEREWQQRNQDKSGSEMYLYFEKSSAPLT
jgi:trans-aconitate methyltransferase